MSNLTELNDATFIDLSLINDASLDFYALGASTLLDEKHVPHDIYIRLAVALAVSKHRT